MLYANKKISRNRIGTVVIPREEEDIVIRVAPVINYDEFTKLCPMPTPPEIIKKGGERFSDAKDPEYVSSLNEWGKRKFYYMIIKSLEATEGLVWEQVDKSDPETWKLYLDELSDAFSDLEMARILDTITRVNGLDDEAIEKATKDFLATEQAQSSE